ncbi:hypothetical protein TNCV_1923811 [Trichonephila clavipes]|nr:hypothetical protein TNCV_1923811 [Trichonephila clavipes]
MLKNSSLQGLKNGGTKTRKLSQIVCPSEESVGQDIPAGSWGTLGGLREGWMGSSGGIPAIRGPGPFPFPFIIERFFWGHVHHANVKSGVEYSSRW